jgi:probable HAF family extracellular repeat protein
MKPQRFFTALLAILLYAAASAHAINVTQWTVIDLGALGTDGALARTVNNKGDVTGQSRAPNQQWHAFLWQNGTMLDLGVPPGSNSSMGFDVNDRGVVLAQNELGRTFVWQNGTWTALPFSGGGKRINKTGDIAGNFAIGSNVHAFLWRNGVFFDLGSFSNGFSSAEGMNDKSIVVGWSQLPSAPFTQAAMHAFLYDGVLHDLGTLGGRDSIATDVNNRNVVVGAAMDATNTFLAFVWDARTGMRALFQVESSATSINDRGAIVGTIQNNGFLLDDGQLTLLESLDAVRAAGFTRIFPVSINDRGWIAANAVRAGDSRLHAVLLIPK